ncbi:hypothetical protein E5D57_001187 [Metarhizium anisopliae]|nr:hypothetical protein E5D57_001187 [Metarhizium anisopliae]
MFLEKDWATAISSVSRSRKCRTAQASSARSPLANPWLDIKLLACRQLNPPAEGNLLGTIKEREQPLLLADIRHSYPLVLGRVDAGGIPFVRGVPVRVSPHLDAGEAPDVGVVDPARIREPHSRRFESFCQELCPEEVGPGAGYGLQRDDASLLAAQGPEKDLPSGRDEGCQSGDGQVFVTTGILGLLDYFCGLHVP